MEDKSNSRPKGFLSTLPAKLAALIGGGLAVLNITPTAAAKPVMPSNHMGATELAMPSGKLPPKLVLKPAANGQLLLAQHDSHASHDSHSSHGSHSSHSSHSSHTSGGF